MDMLFHAGLKLYTHLQASKVLPVPGGGKCHEMLCDSLGQATLTRLQHSTTVAPAEKASTRKHSLSRLETGLQSIVNYAKSSLQTSCSWDTKRDIKETSRKQAPLLSTGTAREPQDVAA